jgi:hypothetical protein
VPILTHSNKAKPKVRHLHCFAEVMLAGGGQDEALDSGDATSRSAAVSTSNSAVARRRYSSSSNASAVFLKEGSEVRHMNK